MARMPPTDAPCARAPAGRPASTGRRGPARVHAEFTIKTIFTKESVTFQLSPLRTSHQADPCPDPVRATGAPGRAHGGRGRGRGRSAPPPAACLTSPAGAAA